MGINYVIFYRVDGFPVAAVTAFAVTASLSLLPPFSLLYALSLFSSNPTFYTRRSYIVVHIHILRKWPPISAPMGKSATTAQPLTRPPPPLSFHPQRGGPPPTRACRPRRVLNSEIWPATTRLYVEITCIFRSRASR
jgi:hypothetical protein